MKKRTLWERWEGRLAFLSALLIFFGIISAIIYIDAWSGRACENGSTIACFINAVLNALL